MSMKLGHGVEATAGGERAQGRTLSIEDMDELEGAAHKSGTWKILEVATYSSPPSRGGIYASALESGLAIGPALANGVLANMMQRLEKHGHIRTHSLAAPRSPVTSSIWRHPSPPAGRQETLH